MAIRKVLCDEDLEAKRARREAKGKRSYEIFDSMPYKFQETVYSQAERHPLSKERFEVANALI